MRISRRMAIYGGKRKRNLVYYGQITSLSMSKDGLASVTLGNHALFAGGRYDVSSVDAFDELLVKTYPASLSHGRGDLGAAAVGDVAIFAGGRISSSATRNFTDAYNSSLTKVSVSTLSKERDFMATVTIGDHALFAGGDDNDGVQSKVEAFSSTLTRTNATSLSQARYYSGATRIGNHALIAGGTDGSKPSKGTTRVDAYDSNLTRTLAPSLSKESYRPVAISINGRAIIFEYRSFADVYDENLTKISCSDVVPSNYPLGISINDEIAVLVNGKVFYAYNKNLTRMPDIPQYKTSALGVMATVGNFIIHAGGNKDASAHAYEIK